MKNKINSIDVYGDLMAFSWSSGDSFYIKLQRLRSACPCAFCSGEKDVFGNTYGGEKQNLSNAAFSIKSFSFVGVYGLKIVWGDGHADGIYTTSLLNQLSSENEKQ